MSSDFLDVPGPLPDDLKAQLGFPLTMRAFIDDRSPEAADAVALLVHVENVDGSISWALSWGAGWRFGIERNDVFTPRRALGQPPASIAEWVEDTWTRVVAGDVVPYTEARHG